MLTERQSRIFAFICSYRGARGYSPVVREIAEELGISVGTVQLELDELEREGYIRRAPRKRRAIEVLFDGLDGQFPDPQFVRVPLLVGEVGAGVSIQEDGWAQGWVDRDFFLPRDLVGTGKLFMLRVRGDSMTKAGVLEDDFVIVREQATARNGQMVAALLEEGITVKTYVRRNGHESLMPASEDPRHEPIDGKSAQIIGTIVSVIRQVR